MTQESEARPRRLIVGVTGATGSIYAIRLLEALRQTDVESHLVLSRWGARTLIHESDHTLDQVRALATHWYKDNDQGARISSGSFVTMGMVILPCSVKTLADIAHGHSGDLVHRAADVVMKERRRLVLAVREAPLTDIHLENMLKLSRMGVVISPPMPAFYNRPQTVEALVDHTVSRILDLFDIETTAQTPRWTGILGVGARPAAKAKRPKRVAKKKTPLIGRTRANRNPRKRKRAA
ncbi:MAG: UbiX family flavin prenyltransferase [Vicinamibacteria bacterium]|nr:UbiX family flavin prenyltransferase [Vicinamibacteria bacterium]